MSDDSRHLLLLAVPGSGKTTVMVSRIARLIGEKRVPPEQILTMTFSREAAKDMASRFHALFPALPLPRFSTIHSFCYQVLRHYAAVYHRQIPQNIETENAPVKKSVLLRQIYHRFRQDFIGDDALEILSSEISFIKNRMIPVEALGEHRFETPDIRRIFEEYELFKKQNSLIDFDDMLSLCLDIFEKCPALLAEYRRQYPYIHLDEAQDSSLLQHRIIQKLASENALFMVGDEDQSIYSFRGACPEQLLDFEKTYPGAKVLKMEQNFRSDREIVTQANQFIKQNKKRYDKSMFCDKPDADSIYDIELADYNAQYGQVLSLLNSFGEGETTAVLYRNNESAVPLIDLFDKKEIPFYIKEHRVSFFKSSVVRDILSFFRLSHTPNDIEAFRNIYYKLFLSKKIYQHVEQHYTEYDNILDLVLSLRILPEYVSAKIQDIRNRLPKLYGMRPLRAIQYIEDSLGYDAYIRSCSDNGCTPENLHQKLNILKSIAAGYDTVEAFIDRLQELEARMNESREKSDVSVILSTIHSAKGLEFDNVILLDLVEGLFPAADAITERSSGNSAPYEEEVRLFYVAATRAKHRLYLMESGKTNGSKTYPSRFLRHLLGEEPEEAERMEGRKLYHTTYRKGVILSVEEDIVTAEFELFGQRSFSLSYCLAEGILRLE